MKLAPQRPPLHRNRQWNGAFGKSGSGHAHSHRAATQAATITSPFTLGRRVAALFQRVTIRLLPWTGEGGKPCYLRTDGETGTVLSRLTDNPESVHLGMAASLLGYVDDALSDERLSTTELRAMVSTLCQAVRDVVRVACPRPAGGRPPRRARMLLLADLVPAPSKGTLP